MPNRSIIRNGNHFIYLESLGWVLIDGPWFERMNPDLGIVVFSKWRPRPISLIFSTTVPVLVEFEIIEWEQVNWDFPLVNYTFGSRLYCKYREMFIRFRYKTGWRVCPDGQLPILHNALEWNDEMR